METQSTFDDLRFYCCLYIYLIDIKHLCRSWYTISNHFQSHVLEEILLNHPLKTVYQNHSLLFCLKSLINFFTLAQNSSRPFSTQTTFFTQKLVRSLHLKVMPLLRLRSKRMQQPEALPLLKITVGVLFPPIFVLDVFDSTGLCPSLCDWTCVERCHARTYALHFWLGHREFVTILK